MRKLSLIIFNYKMLIIDSIVHVSAEAINVVEVESLKGRKDLGICE